MITLTLMTCLLLAPEQAKDVPVPQLTAPTKDGAVPTDAEMAILRAGVKLHQAKKFDEAIATFAEVLASNPDSAAAMYETAMALMAKGELAKAVEMAARSASYRTTELPNILAFFGTAFDQNGEPEKAIDAYDRAIAILPTAGTLYYNKAVTELMSLKDEARATATMKRGVRADPRHATTHLTLGRNFLADDLRTPALLALSRFLVIEPATARTGESFKLWYTVLNSNVQKSADGKLEVRVNPNKKKVEGDLTQLDMYLALAQIDAGSAPPDTPPGVRLVEQFRKLLNVWAQTEAGKDAETFLWTYYMPYFKEMHARNFGETFIYYVSQSVGLPGGPEWLAGHKDQVDAFLAWDKAYVWR